MSQPSAVLANDVDAANRRARTQAQSADGGFQGDVTGLVTYNSAGRLLVIGSDPAQVQRALDLAAPLRPAVLLLGTGHQVLTGVTTWHVPRDEIQLSGWLGAFRLRLLGQGEGEERFDLVLDLAESPCIATALPPPGYLAAGPDAPALEEALDTLRGLVGAFDKPRYFNYDPDICAHGMKGTTACRRCIDACPADAITSLATRVQVEPFLCQGGGACATACPTGAMTYAYPSVEDVLDKVRRLLSDYRAAGGKAPVLLVHDTGVGAERVEALLADATRPSGHLIPLAVEELASLGLEAWISALAYGARAVWLVDTPVVPASARRELSEQLGFAQAILAGLGYPRTAVDWLDAEPAASALMPEVEPAGHAAVGRKRQLFFTALDHLKAQARRAHPLVELPAGAPFGTATVDEKACTLCMACVTVCPGKALLDGQDVPQLRFLEANCVQCGLCTRSCPEDAIWISPRLLLDAQARARTRLLREDSPFQCVSCGKAFATTAVIGRMQQRLAGHSMFSDPKALRRLQMCGDCRVADMMHAQDI